MLIFLNKSESVSKRYRSAYIFALIVCMTTFGNEKNTFVGRNNQVTYLYANVTFINKLKQVLLRIEQNYSFYDIDCGVNQITY